MDGFTFCFLLCFNRFPEEDRRGWIPPPVHLPPLYMETTPGLFGNFFVPRGGARVATQMILRKRGQRKCKGGNWVFFFSGEGAWAWGVKGGRWWWHLQSTLWHFFSLLLFSRGVEYIKHTPGLFLRTRRVWFSWRFLFERKWEVGGKTMPDYVSLRSREQSADELGGGLCKRQKT